MFNKNFIFLISINIFFAQANMQSPVIDLNIARDMILDGNFIAEKTVNLFCGQTLIGSGCIKSPDIKITCGRFDFKGKIICNGTCTIISKEAFDEKMFKREGNGNFIIKIDPNLNASNSNGDNNELRKININGNEFTIRGQWHISMVDAIQKNDLKEVLYLINNRKSYNSKDLDLFMLIAGLFDQNEIAQQFIKLGANANGHDSNQQPYLITAVINKKADFVSFLIKNNADANSSNLFDRIPALLIACSQNDINTVKVLVKAKDINLNASSIHDRQTALMQAAYRGQKEIVEILLDAGADVNITDWHRNKALDYANYKNQKEIAGLIRKKIKSDN